MLLGEPRQPLARPMHQLGVGRKRHRLRLHGGVDDPLGEVRGLGRPRPRRRAEALLDQRHELLFAHPLAPARQRGPVERRLVDEELLAAEQLVVRVLGPACAEVLVGQVVRVLEDRKPRHQPCGQRRMARLVRIDRAKPLLQKPPVDRRGEFRQRVTPIDDLIEPSLEKIALTAVPTLLRPHRESLRRLSSDRESRLAASLNLQDSGPLDCPLRQKRMLQSPRKRRQSGASRFFTEDAIISICAGRRPAAPIVFAYTKWNWEEARLVGLTLVRVMVSEFSVMTVLFAPDGAMSPDSAVQSAKSSLLK